MHQVVIATKQPQSSPKNNRHTRLLFMVAFPPPEGAIKLQKMTQMRCFISDSRIDDDNNCD